MIKIRFANESPAVEVENFNFDDFEFSSVFDTEVFGMWKETFVSISRKDWDERPVELKSIPNSKFQEVRYDIINHLLNIKYIDGDLSDIGNEIGIILGKYIDKEKIGFELEDFESGLGHGISLTDVTHG